MARVSIDNKKYINPYNFISLQEKCDRNDMLYYNGDLTGYIECTLTSKTPIFIPDTRNTEEGFRDFKFFNYDEKINGFIKPVIPGSEIRGMLRSDFEVFTNSCMSTLNKDMNFISRSNSKDIKLPGILKKDNDGNWHLFKAVRNTLHTTRIGKDNITKNNETIYYVNDKNIIKINGENYKTGDLVDFESIKVGPVRKVRNIKSKGNEGILFIGELGGKKDKFSIHDSIFVETTEEIEVNDLNDEVRKLKDIYNIYNDKAFNQKIRNNNKKWYDGYDFKSKILPVWYSKPDNKKRVYLSLACIGKEVYHRTIHELVGSYMPCISKDDICETCNLFGFVSDNDANSSKIRVSDALYNDSKNPYMDRITLKELASPHIANACFYALYTPNTGFTNFPQTFDFNYDNVLTKNDKKPIDSNNITIRGRKAYWHHFDLESIISTPNDRNCEITPVKENSDFNFKIYFNDINKDTLDKLITVINLKYENKDLCHKIGKGKPLGLGSCKIKVNNVCIKELSYDNELVYNVVNYNDKFNNKLEDLSLKDFINTNSISMIEALRIYDFNYISKNYPEAIVDYPKGKKDDKDPNSMFWFMINKSDGFNPYVLMVLPRIIDGKDDNGNEELKETDICINNNKIGSTHGLLLPGYISIKDNNKKI